MSKLVIEIKEPLKENSVLIYRKGEFVTVDIHQLLPELKEVKKIVKELIEEVVGYQNNIDKEIQEFKSKVNRKLEEQHNALEELVK